MEKISVILPVYNAEKTLDKCLSSILKQTYCNYELIIINDGSNDSSLDIINKYILKTNKIILINNDQNIGVSRSRNLGIQKAEGEYITFIDCDDYYEPNALEIMYYLMIEKKVDAVRFSFNRVEKHNKQIKIYNNTYEDKVFQKTEMNIFEMDLIKNNLQAYVWLLITKTNIAKRVIFDENLGMMEDTLWYFYFLKEINNIYFSNKILYNYCVNKNSASNSKEKAVRNIKNMLYLQEKYKELFYTDKLKLTESYFTLLSVIIENIFKLENTHILKEDKIKFYNNLKEQDSYKIIINQINLKKFRLDRRIIILLLNKSRYKTLNFYCKIKRNIKEILKLRIKH